MNRRRHDPYISGLRNDNDEATARGTDTDPCPWCAALREASTSPTTQPPRGGRSARPGAWLARRWMDCGRRVLAWMYVVSWLR